MYKHLNNNVIPVSDIEIPATNFIPSVAVVRGIRVSYKMDSNGTRTDSVDCIRYDCVDPDTYSTFTIKVQAIKSVISKEVLEASETPIFIEIPVEEIVIHPYAIEYGQAKVSILAPYVKLVKN